MAAKRTVSTGVTPSLDTAIADIYSTKLTVRKRGLETLRELLFEDDQGLACVVDSNSLLPRSRGGSRGKTWDNIFEAVQTNFDQTTKPTSQMAFNLIQCIVKRGNTYGPYLSCDPVYDFILSKLNKFGSLPDTFSYGLMQLLQNLLASPVYAASLRGNHWRNIILTLINLFKKSNISKTLILEALNISISYGSNIAEVILVLRKDVVQFYRDICLEQNRSFLPMVLINRGIVLLCRLNAVEFRGILCALGERIVPSIIPTGASSVRDADEEGSIIDILLVQLQIHSPFDLTPSSPAFYADNNVNWDGVLDKIYFFVMDLLEEIARKAAYTKSVSIPNNLLSLAVRVTKLTQDSKADNKCQTNEDLGPQAKRSRTSQKSFHDIVSDIHRQQSFEAAQLVWVQYVTAVLNSFPGIVDPKVLPDLHRLGISLLNSNLTASQEIYAFLRSVLGVERSLLAKGLLLKSNSWSHIWDIAVKSLEVNGARAEALEFIRSLLVHADSNINSLLFLLVENGLEPARETLNLVSEFLSRCTLPEYMNVSLHMRFQEGSSDKACPRWALIKWLINSLLPKCLPCSEQNVARVLVALVVKRSALFMQVETEFEDSYQIVQPLRSGFEEFESWLVRSCFVETATEEGSVRKVWYALGGELGGFVVLEGIVPKLIQCLKDDWGSFCDVMKGVKVDADFLKVLPLLQYRLALLIQVLNYVDLHELGRDTDLRSNLEELFKTVFRMYSKSILKFVDETEGPKPTLQIYSILVLMHNLLENVKLTSKVKEFMVSQYPEQILELWKRSFWKGLPNRDDRSRSDKGQRSPTKDFAPMLRRKSLGENPRGCESDVAISERTATEMASVEGLRCLLSFAAINEEGRAEILRKLFQDCQEIGTNLNPKIQLHFNLCLDVLDQLVLSFADLQEFHMEALTLLQALCRTFHSDTKCAARIWELLEKFIAVIGKEDSLVRNEFMNLMGKMTKELSSQGIDVAKVAFKTLSVLAKSDPMLEWSCDNQKSIFSYLTEMLKSKSQAVRFRVVDLFCDVFGAETLIKNSDSPGSLEAVQQSSVIRKELFELVYTKLLEVYNAPVASDEENVEESINRTSTVISCLVKTVFAYPFKQKRVLFCLLLISKLKSINLKLINRALKNHNLESTKTLDAHFLYCLDKWIELKYNITEFPFLLFDCPTSEDFYVKYQSEIGFQLFLYSELDNGQLLEDFSKLTSVPALELIKKSYGLIMSRLLVALASGMERDTCDSVFERLTKVFGNSANAEGYLKEYLDQVVVNMVGLTFDPKVTATWGCTSVRLPEPEPPFYDERQVSAGFEVLKQKLGLQRKLSVLGYLVKFSPQQLYKILLGLLLRVHNAYDSLEKFWRLHHYAFFTSLLLAEPADIFQELRPFICQFTTYAYLRLLRNTTVSRDFVTAALHILASHVEVLVTSCPEEMATHFGAVVSQVIATFRIWADTRPLVTKILDILVKDSGNVFSKEISLLDPFPSDVEAFREYRKIQISLKYGKQRNEWTLERELRVSVEQNGTFTEERLKSVKRFLALRKADLEEIVMGDVNGFGVSGRGKDTLHALIQMLVRVVTTSKQEEVVLEAARCLGELGPIDLGVLVLPSNGPEVKVKCAGNTIETLLVFATGNLVSDDINLVATTGEVLEALLATTEVADILEGKGQSDFAKRNPLLCQQLLPFKTEAKVVEAGKTVSCDASALETQLTLLTRNECMPYKKWIRQLTCGLIMALRPESDVFHRLLPLCRLKVSFCEEVLPFVVLECLIASRADPNVRAIFSSYCRRFICVSSKGQSPSSPLGFIQGDLENPEKSIYRNKLALRCLLKVIQFLRLHENPAERLDKTDWDNNFLLDINYLDLARAAQFCGAFLTSILYSEIHAYSFGRTGASQMKDTTEIERLLLKAYISIGESDAVYGCGSARYSDFTSNVQHLAQMNQWNRSLAAFDSAESDLLGSSGIATSLKELGLFSTLWAYLKGAEAMNGRAQLHLSEVQYECAWRLSKWDLNSDRAIYAGNWKGTDEVQCVSTVQKSIYESIEAALNSDKLRHSDSIRRGLQSIIEELKHASLESAENVYPFLMHFQMFGIVEDFFEGRSVGTSIDSLLGKWSFVDRVGCSNLKFQEPVLSLRSLLLKAFNDQNPSPTLVTSYDDCVMHLLGKARDAGRLELAERCSANIWSDAMSGRREVEVAKNHWARGEQDIALSILSKGPCASAQNPDLLATSLLLYGHWLSESKSENPNTIMDYFTQSVNLYETKQAIGTEGEISKAYITLARYADSLYQNVSVYAKSEMFQEKMRTLTKARKELEQMQATLDPANVDAYRSFTLLKRQVSLDTQETTAMQQESKRYLTIALKYYLRGLKLSSKDDLLIFRVISLWLDNSNVKETLEIFTSESLPSYKFVIVLHQLSARLGLSGSNGVGEALQKILLTCAQEHPYHTLPVLLAQALMDRDKEIMKVPIKKNMRVDAARQLVETLKRGPLSDVVSQMESMWTALIALANTQEAAKNSAPKAVAENSLIRKIKSMSMVPVPTVSIPVLPNSQYKNSTIGIHRFDFTYVLVGGINSPKKISCIGSNGKRYNMLLKGQDDLRQDAVMQQVFGVMNKLLLAEPKTKVRHLQVRTYKVVPLSQRSGVIEWCEETQTLGGYLIKTHKNYRPKDYEAAECRKKMLEVAAKPNKIKLQVYNDVAVNFRPIFRHFFFERFKDAGTFFERRLSYTRSVATSSMVGYILGLGDRHVLNILVDLKTAEFIHIDLGVAFEQGKFLPTPETVPFRLTRDVVDGMGCCGVEGDFRRSCELTLEVLRNNTEIILTILEVLLYDPLYIWTLSDDRVKKVQPGGRNSKLPTVDDMKEDLKEGNNSATRVLLRLRQKLDGVEEGISSGSTLGTAGHVSYLIQQASDSTRLSRLFPGWQPYL